MKTRAKKANPRKKTDQVSEEIIIFGIGSNLGDRFQMLKSAISMLEKRLDIFELKCSKIYQNQAMLPENAPSDWNKDFLNQAIFAKVKIFKKTDLNFALKILKIVKKIENDLGRKSRPRWAPREIDIDILAIGTSKFQCQELQIPHFGLFERDFFSKTFIEVAPDLFEKLKAIHDNSPS